MPDFSEPSREQQNVVLIGTGTARQAEQLIIGCESCSPNAAIPFDNLFDRVTGNDSAVTDYILSEPALCPRCKRSVLEKTRVESL